MRYAPDHKAATHERILEVAARRFRERGVSGLQIPGCMADAGLSHGGFYNHFASKDEFISETLSRVWSDCQRVSGLKDGTAAAALNRFLGQYLSTAQCERSRGACLLPIALPDADKLPPQAREVLHAAILELTGQIQGLLAQLGEENPADAAALLMAELVGVVTFARAQPLATQCDLLAVARRRLRHKFGLLPPETT